MYNALWKAIVTVTVIKLFLSASRAGARMNHIARTVGSSTRHVMNKTLRVMQLNMRKQGVLQESLINDEDTVITQMSKPGFCPPHTYTAWHNSSIQRRLAST